MSRTPMGIRGALVPVGISDPSLRDFRNQLARLENQSRDIRCGECIPPRGSMMVPLWLESLGCGLRLSRLAPGLQPEWVQVYNPCRVKTICIAAYSVIYNS